MPIFILLSQDPFGQTWQVFNVSGCASVYQTGTRQIMSENKLPSLKNKLTDTDRQYVCVQRPTSDGLSIWVFIPRNILSTVATMITLRLTMWVCLQVLNVGLVVPFSSSCLYTGYIKQQIILFVQKDNVFLVQEWINISLFFFYVNLQTYVLGFFVISSYSFQTRRSPFLFTCNIKLLKMSFFVLFLIFRRSCLCWQALATMKPGWREQFQTGNVHYAHK